MFFDILGQGITEGPCAMAMQVDISRASLVLPRFVAKNGLLPFAEK